MNALTLACCSVLALTIPQTGAAPVVETFQGEETDLPVLYSTEDYLQGLLPEVLEGDRGWHPVNTDPADQLPAFTDGVGLRPSGLTGLLADFPPAGQPTKRILYSLEAPVDISELRVFSGNGGRDGRVFHTYTVRFSSDAGQPFTPPIYVQSHLSGTINSADRQWYVVLTRLTETGGVLAAGVNRIHFDFYGVDNTMRQCRDPFDGVNPFTGVDDGLTIPNTSSLIWEIDVLGQFSKPRLTAERKDTALALAWTTALTNTAVVESSPSLLEGSWTPLSPQPPIQSEGKTFSTLIPGLSGTKFYRLKLNE